MRNACMFLVVAWAGVAHAGPYDFPTVDAVYQEIDRRWPNLEPNEYQQLIQRADQILHNAQGSPNAEQDRLFGARYQRCQGVFNHVYEAFDQIDDAIGDLTATDRGGTASDADRKLDAALKTLGWAQRDWQVGTNDSCGDASAQWTWRILTQKMTLPLETWMEKVKQLDGLAEQRQKNSKVPSLADLKAAPRATVAATASSLPPKFLDNTQYECGSLDAWQKTVTKLQPAGDLLALPGCSKLDGEEGPASVKALSQAKKLVMELDQLDKGGENDYKAGQMTTRLESLKKILARGVWKSPELDPMAMSFERLYEWETNQMKAVGTRSDISNEMNHFWNDYNQKTGKFSGKHYDLFASNADKCLQLIEKAASDGVDLQRTTVKTPDYKSQITYVEARTICQGAKKGMAAKAKAVAEAAAAEDAKWKSLCGGDKYKLWKAHGEHALSRGGWDQSRPEQACNASVWYSHHGPDSNQVYDCDKYTFEGSKQTGHTTKSTRWHMVCP